MTKHLFIISSAVNTKFGDFDSDQRLLQTFRTIKSVYDSVPDPKVAVIESSGIPLSDEVIQSLHGITHFLLDMSKNPDIARIHDSTTNWDVVKNVCEILAFNLAFPLLDSNNMLEGVDRVHKLSGRYTLNNNFDLSLYDKYPDKIIVTIAEPTLKGDTSKQYSARLWSWPAKHHGLIKEFYFKAINELRIGIEQSKYVDIEHLLYDLLPKDLVQEVPVMGVEGLLSGNSQSVEN